MNRTFPLILALFGALTMTHADSELKEASFGGGCFWCLEPFYEQLKGVEKVVSGYQGGTTQNPTYREVTSGRTGHAEVVRVTYDPRVIRYEDLLQVFFAIHDPTTLNRQGADVGTQYRSTILYDNEAQKTAAEAYIAKLADEKVFRDPIVTKVEKAGPFYPAEDYHQDYFANNPQAPYCRMVIAPKLKKIEIPERLLKRD
jgi:peptide-methionine (S)-S-oxide reductase